MSQQSRVEENVYKKMFEIFSERYKKEEMKRKICMKSTFILIFTDILKEMSEMLIIGEYKDQIANGFGAILEDHTFSAPGVLSRKKQVIPSITQSIFEAKN